MPSKQAKKNHEKLDNEIAALLDALAGLSTEDDAYKPTKKKLIDLYALRDNHVNQKLQIEPFLPLISSVAVVLILTTFEARGHAITSKALPFLKSGR